MKNAETGKIGEDIAYKYLLNNGYLILGRNHKESFYEIDIIARQGDGVLIFCEVKTINKTYRMISDGFMPEDNLSPMKRRKMIRAAEVFLVKRPGLAWENRGWQMDLIAIILKDEKLVDLRHYENI